MFSFQNWKKNLSDLVQSLMLCEKSEDQKNEVSCSKLLKYVMAESKFSKYPEHFSPHHTTFTSSCKLVPKMYIPHRNYSNILHSDSEWSELNDLKQKVFMQISKAQTFHNLISELNLGSTTLIIESHYQGCKHLNQLMP